MYLSVLRPLVHFQGSNCSFSFFSLCACKYWLRCDKVFGNGSKRIAGMNKRGDWDILFNKSTDCKPNNCRTEYVARKNKNYDEKNKNTSLVKIV